MTGMCVSIPGKGFLNIKTEDIWWEKNAALGNQFDYEYVIN